MLTWRDAEEEAELVQLQAMWDGDSRREPVYIEEIERPSLRNRLATALVQIGVKLDPSALEAITSDDAA